MPLTNKWWVSKKKDKEAWVEPIIDYTLAPPMIHFLVKTGKGQPQVGTVDRQGAFCIACKTPVTFDYLRTEGKAKRMSTQLMAIVADGQRSRLYLSPNEKHESIATQAVSDGIPDTDLPEHALGFRVQLYGMTKHSDLFSSRQLAALTAISDLVQEARNKVIADAASNDVPSDVKAHKYSNTDALDYANAVSTYLAIAVDRLADRSSTICSWDTSYVKIDHTFARQAIPMIWNFAESNPMSDSTGNFLGAIEWIAEVVQESTCSTPCEAIQKDAICFNPEMSQVLISTDPPYYDNIGYADLSDFFYIWLRRSLNQIYPDLFGTMLVPKTQELIATPFRFGGNKGKAQEFFETSLGKVFERMRLIQNPDYPLPLS